MPLPPVTSPLDLAKRMAQLARLLNTATVAALADPSPNRTLLDHRDAIRKNLLPTISDTAFADLYAQTITYGLFAARVMAPEVPFTLTGAVAQIPAKTPLLKAFFSQIEGPGLKKVIEELVSLLATTNISKVLANFDRATLQQDPLIHFYETFLAAYDPRLRERRGVYYTPAPVVSYLVRSVDLLLKQTFGKPAGLADEQVSILDPATGTGTFLNMVVREIHTSLTQTIAGTWHSYVKDKLLSRIYGFELLMAPYIIAHLNLFLLLRDLSAPLQRNQRLGIYLTNALAEASLLPEVPSFDVMVIIGNPPYSGQSLNVSEWITRLIDDYKKVDGLPLGERNSKWLQDDYVKFIRFAQWRITETSCGIVAFITNNGYLDNPTFRGMRQSLMQTFDTIYLLNLHGSAKKKERDPNGGPDENVFDIQQGVTIGLFVRQQSNEGSREATVHYADLWGKRDGKYVFLQTQTVNSTAWERLKPTSPWYLFVPQDQTLRAEYEQGWKVTDIFPLNSVGIVTARDRLTVQWNKEELLLVVRDFAALPVEEAREKYKLGEDVRDWKVALAQEDLRSHGIDEKYLAPILYRPFDLRTTYYTGQDCGFLCRPRRKVMRNMLTQPNLGLITIRRSRDSSAWRSAFVAETMIAGATAITSLDINYFFPLYLTANPTDLFDDGRRPNLSPAFIKALEQALELPFMKGKQGTTFGPEDVFHYIYAVLHHPTYRARYAEFLKMDFPRIPLPLNSARFSTLCKIGEQLVDLHLLRPQAKALSTTRVTYPVAGSNKVGKVSYDATQQRVLLNSTQYFEKVEGEAWEIRIGGYQPARKWLEDRKGRTLSYDEIKTYTQIIAALAETGRLMRVLAEEA